MIKASTLLLKCFVFLVLFACSDSKKQAAETKTTVNIETAKMSQLQERILYPARVLSEVFATVKSPSSGRITKIFSHVGSKVKQGSPLISVKNLDPSYEYSSVVVRSPVLGNVWQLDVTLGTELNSGDKIATIINPNKLEVRIEVPAADMPKLLNAESIQLLRDDSKSFELKDLRISPMVDLQTGTSTSILKIPAEKHKLVRPGEVVNVDVLSKAKSSLIVAGDAIKYRKGLPHIQVLKDKNVIELRSVEIGLNRGDTVEVVNGLELGERYVVRSTRYIVDGEEVVLFEDKNKDKPAKATAR